MEVLNAARVKKAKKPEPLSEAPGVVYKPSRDHLYVFDRKEILVISGGPIPQAWRKTAERGWCAARPSIPHYTVHLSLPEAEESPLWHLQDGLYAKGGQYLFPFMEQVRDACYGHRAWVAWLRGLDYASRRAVEPFWERQWHLLMLAMRCPGAMDLMRSCPALAFALASSWVFRGEQRVRWPLRSARSLVRKRQRAIAGWLGFPATESAVRVLRRVPHAAVSIGSVLRLRNAMHDEELAPILRHVPSITYDVVRMISSDGLRRYCSPRLIIEAGSEPDPQRAEVWRTMRDTLAMFRQMDQEPDGLVFRSREHLGRVHDETAAALNRSDSCWSDAHLPIPPPPLQGTEAIIPLTEVVDFCKEGREQSNCVATYASSVAASAARSRDGRPGLYVYRVLRPERATLSIIRRGSQWLINELRCAHNQPPAAGTVAAVRQWLDAQPCTRDVPCEGGDLRDWNLPPLPDYDEECLVRF